MLGRNYWKTPEVLVDSYYKIQDRSKPNAKNNILHNVYIFMFGIPDIGFQLRGKYFLNSLKTLSNFTPNNILDAGSGIGFYTFRMSQMYPNSKIDGIDIDQHKLEFCKKYIADNDIQNISFSNKNLVNEKLKKNNYDLIVNVDVLEHVNDYMFVLKNFYSALRPGGVLYLHTPQINQTRIFKKYFQNWVHEEHVREGFDKNSLKSNLLKIGFQKVYISEGFGFWGKMAWEIVTICMDRSQILGALIFPLAYCLTFLDKSSKNDSGLSLYLLAKK
jgi:2-polyprenyl-3-methyl-5-hydroxy-6-metoxy-1,4-benzoquinol methylase